MSLPIDRTAKSALDTNLVNGNTSDAPKIKASNDVVYNTIDELNSKIDGLVNSGILSPIPPDFMSRQAIINGNFDVWQRGTSFTNPANGTYTSDHYSPRHSEASGYVLPTNVTHSRLDLTPGDIPISSLAYRITVDGAGSNLGAGDNYRIVQYVENGTRYLCGAGKSITLSFYARSSISGKRLGFMLSQEYGSGGSPSAVETITGSIVTLTSTWTKYTFTFSTNTLVGKTFGTNRDDRIGINFIYVVSTGNSPLWVGISTSETFVGAGTIDIAQVQLCAGSVTLPFQPRSFAEEFALCQRYYEKSYNYGVIPGTVDSNGSLEWIAPGVSAYSGIMAGYKVRKRVTPTVTIYSTNSGAVGQAYNASTTADVAASIGASGESNVKIQTNNVVAAQGNAIRAHWTADAEM